MREVLWFRRDLRISDNAILASGEHEVLPIFIFDPNILEKLAPDDRRVSFIYQSVIELKAKLRERGLDLYIFYDTPINVFKSLKNLNVDRVLCSVDYDHYATVRDRQIESILPMVRYQDSFIVYPHEHFNQKGDPYRVFTPFFRSLEPIWSQESLPIYTINPNLKLIKLNDHKEPTLESMGFTPMPLPAPLDKPLDEHLHLLAQRIEHYEQERDRIDRDATSNLALFLRFGLISPIELFNFVKRLPHHQPFVRQIFWREFYHYLLFHFPQSEFNNLLDFEVEWSSDSEALERWQKGETGIPIIDAAMRHFNATGLMHNRLRMITSSYLTKNLLIDWREGEAYFARKLLDYEASSNVGSWQWAASTGADSVPYFRIFNPYTQAKKFDPKGEFVRSVLDESEINVFEVDLSFTRDRAIKRFKAAKSKR
jgi:deoxyribodipyrimidine photo-lyase